MQSRLYQDNSSDTSIWEDGWQNDEDKVSGKVHVNLHEMKVNFVLLMTNLRISSCEEKSGNWLNTLHGFWTRNENKKLNAKILIKMR